MAKAPQLYPVAEDAQGNRIQWNGAAWVDLPSRKARGGAYLPQARMSGPDPSEDAYFRQFRTAQDPGVAAAKNSLANYREFEGLLSKQNTGGRYALPGGVGKVLGWFDPEVRRMEALSASAARAQRQPGEGTISDFDAKMFLSMVPGVAQPTETNRMNILAGRAAAENALQRRQMADWYHSTYGTTEGFEEAWNRYRDENPIFDPASERSGRPMLNAKRQNWREYYGAVRGAADATPSSAIRDIRESQRTPMPKAAQAGYQRLYKAGGIDANAKMGSAKNPFLARDADTLNRLPKGSYAISPDGVLGIIR